MRTWAGLTAWSVWAIAWGVYYAEAAWTQSLLRCRPDGYWVKEDSPTSGVITSSSNNYWIGLRDEHLNGRCYVAGVLVGVVDEGTTQEPLPTEQADKTDLDRQNGSTRKSP